MVKCQVATGWRGDLPSSTAFALLNLEHVSSRLSFRRIIKNDSVAVTQEPKRVYTTELPAFKPFFDGDRAELLRGDEADDHADDAGAARAAAQVHARVPDFVLQQLVQLPAELLHQLSHLGNTHTFKDSSLVEYFHIFNFKIYVLGSMSLCNYTSFSYVTVFLNYVFGRGDLTNAC